MEGGRERKLIASFFPGSKGGNGGIRYQPARKGGGRDGNHFSRRAKRDFWFVCGRQKKERGFPFAKKPSENLSFRPPKKHEPKRPQTLKARWGLGEVGKEWVFLRSFLFSEKGEGFFFAHANFVEGGANGPRCVALREDAEEEEEEDGWNEGIEVSSLPLGLSALPTVITPDKGRRCFLLQR